MVLRFLVNPCEYQLLYTHEYLLTSLHIRCCPYLIPTATHLAPQGAPECTTLPLYDIGLPFRRVYALSFVPQSSHSIAVRDFTRL